MLLNPVNVQARYYFVWMFILGSLVLPGSGQDEVDTRVINTNGGKFRGLCRRSITDEICEYLGIPYARPPVGDLRFKHPRPLDVGDSDSVYNATRLPPSCFQTLDTSFGGFPGSSMWNPKTGMSEDCLYLNIWVPGGGAPKKAVMVWIHGGSFTGGSITRDMFNGSLLSSRNDVTVVTITYRVGPFGFLHLDHPDAPGNAGLFDQRMALEWVQQHIDSFGGDSRNVTLFGNSAGGFSVGLHLLSPHSEALFHRAILQSGTPLLPNRLLTPQEAKRRSINIATHVVGCSRSDDLDEICSCMKSVPAHVLQEALSRTQLPSRDRTALPIIDGDFIPSNPADLLAEGKFKKCPIMIGTVLNEGSYFVLYALPGYLNLTHATMTRSQFVESLHRLVGAHVLSVNNTLVQDAISFQYTDWTNPNDTQSNLDALGNALGDVYNVCPQQEFEEAYALHGQDVYSYQFTERYSRSPWPQWMGVMHGDEIFFVFGAAPAPGLDLTQEEEMLSRAVMSYWASFAKSGNPNEISNVTSLGIWPTYSTKDRKYMELNSRFLEEAVDPRAVGRDLRVKECAFWKHYIPGLIDASSRSRILFPDAIVTGMIAILQTFFVCVKLMSSTTWTSE